MSTDGTCPLCFQPPHPNSWCFGPPMLDDPDEPVESPAAPGEVKLYPTSPDRGCTGPGCGTQATVVLHPYKGRQCPAHMTLPPGGFRADLAADRPG